MKQNRNLKWLAFFLIIALVLVALPSGQVSAASSLCVNTDGADGCYTSIQSAVDAAAAGDTITIAPGTYSLTSTVIINKALTIAGTGEAIVQTTTPTVVSVFEIDASDVTISGLTITDTALPAFGVLTPYETSNSLIKIPNSNMGLTNISILNNTIYVPAQSGAMSTWNGIGIYVNRLTVTGLTISGNTIYNTRGGVVISYNNAVNFSNNVIYNTKGGIMNYTGSQADADNRVMSNNSWNGIHNEWDIVWNSGGGPYEPDYHQQVLLVSQNNNDAYVVSQMTATYSSTTLTGNRSHVFVNAATGTTVVNWSNGNINTPYAKIQDAVNAVVPGGKVIIASGTYTENVNVNKSADISGAGQGNTIVEPAISNPDCGNPNATSSLCSGASNVFLVAANDVTIHDLTVDGDNPALTSTYNVGTPAANLDARNGIIKSTAAAYTNMEVYNTTVKNIYLRGIYSTGGSFNFHDNTVSNVQATPYSIAMFAWGGPGIMQNNTVSDANDAISANHSNGIQFLNNTITNSQSGVHTDNSGDGGGVADVISGNTVSDCTSSGYGIWTFVNYLPVTVQNNTVTNCALPYSIWGSHGTNAVQFSNNTATAPTDATGSVGMYVTTDMAGYGYSDVSAQISGNHFEGFENGIYMDAAQQSWETGPYTEKSITATFFHNQIVGSTLMQADTSAAGHFSVDLTANWWGSAGGPEKAKINAGLGYTPWCADAACTTLAPVDGKITLPSGVSAEEIQRAIDNAPANTIIVIPAGIYNFSGGYHVDNPHLTILLEDGVVIQNSSPCFDVNASYTTITTESAGGAKCVPTNGANGINVATGLQNVIIQGLEVDGSGQSTVDGINFAGAITDVQVLDNYIHALGGNGLTFAAAPAGVVDVQGNLFKANGGVGVSAPANLDVSYNSWGSKDGPAAGDGVSASITSTAPFTHADLSMTSSGTPWPNHVLPGYTITYMVKGNFHSVMAADFTVSFPSNLTLTSTTLGSYFTTPADGYTVLTTSGNTIHFSGTANSAVSGDDLVLYTATFTAGTITGSGALQFDTNSDQFAMLPPLGPSTNVYASALADGIVNVIADLPTMNAVGLDVPFTVGYAQEFSLVINNPVAGVAYAHPQLQFTLPADAVLQYYNGSNWVSVSGGTLNLAALAASGSDVTVQLRVTFGSSATVAFSAKLYETTDVSPDALLASATANVDVQAAASLTGTFSMQGRTVRSGIPVTLTGTLFGALNGTTIDVISGNLTINNVVGYDTYTVTTDQSRYLNVTADLNKTVDGDAGTMAALELKGGNAKWTDNVINVDDASQVGHDWGSILDVDGDVNFSGKVDIFDLAIVGGNYNLTSGTAYGTWVP